MFKTISPKIVTFMRQFEKCGTARQAIEDETVPSVHVPCWLTKAAHIHLEYVVIHSLWTKNSYAARLIVTLYALCLSSWVKGKDLIQQ